MSKPPTLKSTYVKFLKACIKDKLKDTVIALYTNTENYEKSSMLYSWKTSVDVDYDSDRCWDISINAELTQEVGKWNSFWKLQVFIDKYDSDYDNLNMTFTYDVNGDLNGK